MNDISEFSSLENIKVDGNLITNSIAFAKMAAVEGKGVACLPLHYVDEEMMLGKLIKVLPEMESVSETYDIVYPSRAFLSTSAKRFIDFMQEEVKNLSFDFSGDAFDQEFWL